MKSSVFCLSLLVVALAAGSVAVSAASSMTVSPVEAHPTDPREPGGSATSTLYRNEGGIAASIETKGLDEATYTVWWVLFNNPQYCASNPCTGADLPANGGDPRVQASVLFAAGGFVGANGRGLFGAGLAVGDTSRALFGPGLIAPETAEVHLMVRTHGPLDMESVHLQVSTPGGGCPANGCKDQQFTIHR